MDIASIRRWRRIVEEGYESDSWDQVVEANDAYERAASQIEGVLESIHGQNKNFLNKVMVVLRLRKKSLNRASGGVTSDMIRDVIQALSDVEGGKPAALSIDLSQFSSANDDDDDDDGKFNSVQIGVPLSDDENEDEIEVDSFRAGGSSAASSSQSVSQSSMPPSASSSLSASPSGSLLPPPKQRPGNSYLSVTIDKIGLKDASTYLDPFVTITLVDRDGKPLETAQATPYSSSREYRHLVFNSTVHIQTPLSQIPRDAALFFEFMHYKPKKSKISTRCFSLMEKEEIKPGRIALEIYKKPTDFLRKSLYLFSVKPLYLHLKVDVLEL